MSTESGHLDTLPFVGVGADDALLLFGLRLFDLLEPLESLLAPSAVVLLLRDTRELERLYSQGRSWERHLSQPSFSPLHLS